MLQARSDTAIGFAAVTIFAGFTAHVVMVSVSDAVAGAAAAIVREVVAAIAFVAAVPFPDSKMCARTAPRTWLHTPHTLVVRRGENLPTQASRR